MNPNVTLKSCRHGFMMFDRTDLYVGRSLELYGEFSPNAARLFGDFVRPGMTVLDVGANVGAHTVFFARRVTDSGRVIAFEADRLPFQLLAGNCAINGLENVFASLATVSNERGPSILREIDVRESGHGSFPSISMLGPPPRPEKAIEIPAVRIDDLGLRRCDFIRIDVEGREVAILEGAEQTISAHRPAIYVENDPSEDAKLCALLAQLEYRGHFHTARLYSEDNFNGNPENVFGAMESLDLLCLPSEGSLTSDLPAIDFAEDF